MSLNEELLARINSGELPRGMFKYTSYEFAVKHVPELQSLFGEVIHAVPSIVAPRITYRYQRLLSGNQFGHGRVHYDGYGVDEEVHRLLTVNGSPTRGFDGQELTSCILWEFDGAYPHWAVSTEEDCWRLLIRVSQTDLPYRNHMESIK